MAGPARCLAVGLVEWKSGALGMVEAEIGPFPRPVTVAALGAKAAGVHVFARVASRAILGELSFSGRLVVARDAARLQMGADQWETTLLLVIEALLVPGGRCVAVGAAITESARMLVIDRMTRDAVCRRLLVSGPHMAADTACRLMFPDQPEFRFVVIELIRFPTGLAVTAATIR